MSHVEKLESAFRDTPEGWEEAKLAAELLGGVLLKKGTYVWYGRHVGDYPMPAGFTKEMLGKCDYAIQFPGITYEVGLAKDPTKPGSLTPLYDFWDKRLAERLGGNKAPKLIQAMVEATTTLECRRKGHIVERITTPDGGILLVVADKKDVSRKPTTWQRIKQSFALAVLPLLFAVLYGGREIL